MEDTHGAETFGTRRQLTNTFSENWTFEAQKSEAENEKKASKT